MNTILSGTPATTPGLPSIRKRSTASAHLETAGRWTNRISAGAALAQFYTAGMAVFGAASFSMHARVGWLVQLGSLLTTVTLLAARTPFRTSRFAILILLLAILQPVLAFAVRPRAPELAALHPVNGVILLALCLLLERRLRQTR
jgi:hypothetical protein